MIKGRLISVSTAEESSHLAFSASRTRVGQENRRYVQVLPDGLGTPDNRHRFEASRDGRNPVAARDGTDNDMKNVRVLLPFQLIRDYMKLNRHSQVKVAAMITLSKGLIRRNDRVVCLSGSPEYGILDNLAVLDLEREFELLSSGSLDIAGQMAQPEVFERLLTIVLELAVEGKEGKPLGTVFVLGDHEKVLSMSSQMVINPFVAVPEEERNILDPALKETLREFSSIDGAFVIRDDGVVLAAGRHLAPSVETSELPQGLGARHRSAAGITALTNAIAVVISESTGDVRIFSRGKLYMEIEKAK